VIIIAAAVVLANGFVAMLGRLFDPRREKTA
jgi:hypothetical protein